MSCRRMLEFSRPSIQPGALGFLHPAVRSTGTVPRSPSYCAAADGDPEARPSWVRSGTHQSMADAINRRR